MEVIQCVLCCQPPVLIGLMPCNHRHICHICSIKLCDKNLCQCPICKISSGVILFSSNLEGDYHSITKNKLIQQVATSGMTYLYADQIVKDIVERQNKIVCYFQTCYLSFTSMNGLKKHMNQSHKRQFCDICLENRKCLLFQQKIYTDPELTIHHNQGQVQNGGTISIYHPFCQFCRVRYYDQEAFLRHMKNHEQCHICNKYSCNKYIYYKDYYSLENHYEKSHFVCKHGNCEDSKMMQVFETEDLREYHYSQKHLGQNFSNKVKKKIEVMTLTGFNMVEHNQKPKDHIGVCVQNQLLSVSRKFELKIEQHQNGPIDFRQFYPEKCKSTKTLSIAQIVQKLKYRASDQQALSLQTIDFFKPLVMKSLSKKQICELLQKVYSNYQFHSIRKQFFDSLNDNVKKDFEDYCINLQSLLVQNQSHVPFLYVFPQLIRFFKDQNLRKPYMDDYYLRRLATLPCQIQNLIILAKTYDGFIVSFTKSLESVILSRIHNKTINLSHYLILVKTQNSKYLSQQSFYVQKQKIFNLFRMINRLPSKEVLKMNWLLKLGITTSTHDYITKGVYFQHPKQSSKLLQRLTNQQLALVYIYYKILDLSFNNKNMFKLERQNCNTHILRDLMAQMKINAPSIEKQLRELEKQSKDNIKTNNVKITTTKITKMVVNRQLEPQLPKLQTPKQKEQTKSLLGFNNPVPFIKTWDEDHARNKNKKKRMTEQQQLRLALQQSKSMYQQQVEKAKQIKMKQEIADNKKQKISNLLNKLQPQKQRKISQDFPSLESKQQTKPEPTYQINFEQYDKGSKKKNKKWQQFDPKTVKKQWDQTSSRNKPKQTNFITPNHDQQFPELGGEKQQKKQVGAWYDKIVPPKKVQVVQVKIKKKKGKTIIQQTVDIFKR